MHAINHRFAYLFYTISLLVALFIGYRQRMWKISRENACGQQLLQLHGVPFARFCELLYDFNIPLLGVRYHVCWPGWVYNGDCDK